MSRWCAAACRHALSVAALGPRRGAAVPKELIALAQELADAAAVVTRHYFRHVPSKVVTWVTLMCRGLLGPLRKCSSAQVRTPC